MNSNWFLYNKQKNIKEISQKFGLSALASVFLCNREVSTFEEIEKILSSDINDINAASLLPDIDKASKILDESIKANKKIRIVGDYDIDGVCATYILYDSIKRLGADVSYAIPDRILDGYGINISIIDKAIEDKIDLIITCDNGIAAAEQIKYAKEHGIEVIVTDHHDIGEFPSSAEAVVNPKRDDVSTLYPYREICGASVAWKFMMRYYELYKNDKNFIIDNYLEFAMLATIGDIMPLKNENHIIAKVGLKKILNTKNKGLRKLLDISGIDFSVKSMTVYHIGFIIGPLINAAGRMEKASLVLELFNSSDDDKINDIAYRLKELNDERKKITEDGSKIAIEMIEKEFMDDKVLVVYIDDLEEQVAGIVAGRVKEKYNKPTIILTNTSDASEVKASCRSIDSYDIYEALSVHKDLFLKFGGHKLAAGFSMDKKNIDHLREMLNKECKLADVDFLPKIHIDAEIPFYVVDINIMNEFENLEPYGQGFEKPLFVTRDVHMSIKNVYGNEKNVVQIVLSKDGKVSKGIAFLDSVRLENRLSEDEKVDIVYFPRINEFRGAKTVEINVKEYR